MNSFEEENLYLYPIDNDPLNSEAMHVSSLLKPFDTHASSYYILQGILESGTSAEIGIYKTVLKNLKQLKKTIVLDHDEKNKELNKWLVKSLQRDGYKASLLHTCWPTTFNCPGGDHEFIEITHCQDKRSGLSNSLKRIIVDTDFKSQFEVARPTSKYMEICDMLPSIFTGDEQRLDKIVLILCDEADNSFNERGLYVPPWRTTRYMKSKWFSPSVLQHFPDDHEAASAVDGFCFVK